MPDPEATNDAQHTSDGTSPFRDAEAWLAEKGIRREPLVISGPDDAATASAPEDEQQERPQAQPQPPAPPPIGAPAPPAGDEEEEEGSPDGGAPLDAATDSGTVDHRARSGAGPDPGRLDDRVSEAAAYARRATASTPLSEARLRSKMESRGYPPPVVTQAMHRARAERLVDDHAYAMALVEEGRDKGHAPLRIKTDMQKRDLSDEAIEAALDTIGDRDPEAQAFAVARDRARRYRDVDTETAYRRLVGYLARRGYTEALSRKVAREAVFNDREPQRTAER